MILYYIRIAFRALLRKKVYSLTNLFGLAIGMASCTLILLFVLDELSYDQYHKRKDRIYRLTTQVETGIAKVNGPWGPAALSEIAEVENMTRFVPAGQLLFSRDAKRFYESGGFYADSTSFEIFSFKLLAGNPQTALTEPNSIVVTKDLAERYFGNGEALGQSLYIDGQQEYKVTGILEDVPSNSHFTFPWLLSMSSLQHPQRDNWVQWNQFYTYLLLRKDAQPKTVEEKFKPILLKNMDAQAASNYNPVLQSLTSIHLYSHLSREITPNSDIHYIYIFSSIALLILTISCANFINIFTVQVAGRAREIGVRKVNGALKKQVVFQFFTEVFLICLSAVLLAQLLAIVALPVLNELTNKNLQIDYIKNPASFIGILAVAILTTLLAGSYPAWYQATFKPVQVLKGKWTPAGSGTLRKNLVVFQFILSSLLVIGSIVILQQLHFIQKIPLGFDPQQIIIIPIQSDDLRKNNETVKQELLSHPGILSVSLSGNLPGGSDWGIPCLPEGFTADNVPQTRIMAVDDEFIRTYGMEILEGRDFSKSFASDSATYLMNEEAARQYGWTDPLSKTIAMPAIQRQSASVVGVVKDFHFRSMHEKISPLLFFIPPKEWFSLYSVKIDARQTENVLSFIEQKFYVFDPVHPFTYNFFNDSYNRLHQQEVRLARIVGYFTIIGIFLACLGLYSLASYTTEQRTKEIGIRKVIGASAKQIIVMLSKQYLLLVVIGFTLAVPVAWYVLRQWLQSFAYHVEFNILLIIGCGLFSAVVALLTVGYKAMQAAGANPVDSLRNE